MTTLLIDGDIEAFKAASVNQDKIDWGDGDLSVSTNPKGAEDYLVSALSHYQDVLNADRMIVCLTDKGNWRKKLWPPYKANRKDKVRPELLGHCRNFLMENFETECWVALEADDVMGILSHTTEDSVIVSVDKDMRGVPCRLYNPGKAEEGIVSIGVIEAFRWHMLQTLTGDVTDGYKGCPGIGPKKAAAIIDPLLPPFDSDPCSVVDSLCDFENGKKEIWKAIVNVYEEKSLTARDAEINAKLAYILRYPHEYNRKTMELCLWQPPV